MKEILEEIKQLKDLVTAGTKQVLNVGEVATVTGMSKSYIRKLVYLKKIPYYKSEGGKLTYFKREDIEKFMLGCRVPTNEELEQTAIQHTLNK